MSVLLRRKVPGDWRRHWPQLGIMALAVVIGAFGMTATLGARAVLDREIAASFEASLPPDIVVILAHADERAEAVLRGLDGIATIEPRRILRAMAEVAPGDWRNVLLFGMRDFGRIGLAAFRPVEGAWPPPAGAVLIERSSRPVAGSRTALALRLPGQAVRAVPIAGIVLDPGQAPGWQDDVIYAYATSASLDTLAPGIGTEQLLLAVPPAERGAVAAKAAQIAAALDAAGIDVLRVTTPPRAHPHADQMRTILAMLAGLAGFAVLLAGMLTAALLAALLARHVRQIGILQALGAGRRRVALAYFAFIGIPVVAATLAGAALGVPAARALTRFCAERINVEPQDLSIPAVSLALAIGISLATALVAVAVRVGQAAALTVRAALADGTQLVPVPRRRLVVGDRRLALALRNLFRWPARLLMTVSALALGGAVLLTALNVYDSLLAALDRIVEGRQDEMTLTVARARPAAELLALADAPGIRRVEAWNGALFGVAHPGSPVLAGTYMLAAPPADSAALRPRLAAGRWPDRPGEIAVSGSLLAREPGLTPGARVEIAAGKRSVPVTVTGVIEEIMPIAYAAPETAAALTGQTDAAALLWVVAEPGQGAAVAAALQERAQLAGVTASVLTIAKLRQVLADHFVPMLSLLVVASGGAIAVGALSLAAGLALTVLERAREIAVIRAIGATPEAVRVLLLVEAGAVGAASAVLAGLLSLPLAWLLDRVIAEIGFHAEVPFRVAWPMQAAWLAGSVVLAGGAALLAARGAARRSIRAVLAQA